MKKKDVKFKLVWKQGELKKFWAFMTERYDMWYRRSVLKEKYPWTKDPVLSRFKFCNVFRRLDKGSIYVFEHILMKGNNDAAGIESIIFNVMLYRLFNLPYTYELLGGFNEVGKMRPIRGLFARLIAAKNRGYRLFSDAYLTAPGNELHGRIKAIGYLEAIYEVQRKMKVTCKCPSILNEIAMSGSMYEAWMLIRRCRFFGPFIAYQVVLDLMVKFNWPDKKTFVYVGPGAKSAMDSFLEARWLSKVKAAKENPGRKYIDKVYDKAILELVGLSTAGLIGVGFGRNSGTNWAGEVPVDIHDIEFCCCEYRKYKNINAMLKGGRRVKLRSYKTEV